MKFLLGIVFVVALSWVVADFVGSQFPAGRLSETYRDSRREGPKVGWPVFSHDSKRVAYQVCASACEIRVVDIATDARLIIAPPDGAMGTDAAQQQYESYSNPSFHPDGKHIVFVRYRQPKQGSVRPDQRIWSIVVADQAGKTLQEVFAASEFRNHPLVLEDGRHIVFVASTQPEDGRGPDSSRLQIGDMRDETVKPISGHTSAWQFVPQLVLRDELVYWTFQAKPNTGTPTGLFRVNLTGGSPRVVMGNTEELSHPRLLPEGGIAYTRRTDVIDKRPRGDYWYDIFVREGSTDRRITQGVGYIKTMMPSPDGRLFVAVVTPRPDRREYVMVYTNQGKEVLRVAP